jgi:hypothetical protein
MRRGFRGLRFAATVPWRRGGLHEVFGEADVAGEAGEAGDDAGGLDAPDGFDGAV